MPGSAPYKPVAKGAGGSTKQGAVMSPAKPSKMICPPRKVGGRR